jgi:hypothetical protein
MQLDLGQKDQVRAAAPIEPGGYNAGTFSKSSGLTKKQVASLWLEVALAKPIRGWSTLYAWWIGPQVLSVSRRKTEETNLCPPPLRKIFGRTNDTS